MDNEERNLLADIYRGALSAPVLPWDVYLLCWKAAETDRALEAMLILANEAADLTDTQLPFDNHGCQEV